MRYNLPLLAIVIIGALIGVARTEPHGSEGSPSVPVPEDLAIIVNKANPVDSLSLAELRNVFLAERSRWPNGRKVTITMLDVGNPERDVVLRTIYRMREADFNRNFLRARFAGETTEEPKLLASPTNMVAFVFNAPGAIGYVRASSVNSSIKVLRIDGHVPGETGYRIKLQN